MKPRIAVLTGDDKVWSLDAWARTLPLLTQKAELVGIWVFPEQLGKSPAAAIPWWYFKTFGLADFLRLGFYAFLKKRIVSDWKTLADSYGVPFFSHTTPNDPNVCEEIRSRNVDVVFITVNQILKGQILQAPTVGIISKHSALLPAARGVFPFLWSLIHDWPTGVTLHKVSSEIDRGRILCQMKIEPGNTPSMLRFYIDAHWIFPEMAMTALDHLLRGEFKEPSKDLPDKYFSFPKRSDVARFRKKGGRVSSWGDLHYQSTLRFEENFP